MLKAATREKYSEQINNNNNKKSNHTAITHYANPSLPGEIHAEDAAYQCGARARQSSERNVKVQTQQEVPKSEIKEQTRFSKKKQQQQQQQQSIPFADVPCASERHINDLLGRRDVRLQGHDLVLDLLKLPRERIKHVFG
jgi:hypothetical protein